MEELLKEFYEVAKETLEMLEMDNDEYLKKFNERSKENVDREYAYPLKVGEARARLDMICIKYEVKFEGRTRHEV